MIMDNIVEEFKGEIYGLVNNFISNFLNIVTEKNNTIQLLETSNENVRISINELNLKNTELNSTIQHLESECENYQKV